MKSKKSSIERILEMHQQDVKSGTKLVRLSNHFVSSRTVKAGAEITMGAEAGVSMDLLADTHVAFLLVISKKELYQEAE